MADIYNFSQVEILAFFLVLIRMTSFVVSWPVFGIQTVPASAKILFALIITMVVFPIVGWNHISVSLDSEAIIMMSVREAVIGLSMGFLARMFFFAVAIAGQIVSVSMGISTGQLYNPALGEQSSALEQFQVIIASLFFLAMNGHHIFMSGVVDSFRIVPLSDQFISVQVFGNIGLLVQEIMDIGLQLSAPVLIAILMMNITMAVIGRTVPQINVLITSLPVNILVGFAILIITIPMWIWEMHELLEITSMRVFQVLKEF